MVLLLTASANSSLSDNKVQQYNVGYEIGRSDQELKICNVYSGIYFKNSYSFIKL